MRTRPEPPAPANVVSPVGPPPPPLPVFETASEPLPV